MRFKLSFWVLGLIVALAACAGPATPVAPPGVTAIPVELPTDAPTLAPEPTAVVAEPTVAAEPTATLAPTLTATTPPEPTATFAAEPAEDQYGMTEDGYFVRGLASAPVVIEDYSDFL